MAQLLRASGFERVRVVAAQPLGVALDGIEADTKRLCALTLESIADAAIAEGVADRDELDRVREELDRLAADPDTLMSMPRIMQAWGAR